MDHSTDIILSYLLIPKKISLTNSKIYHAKLRKYVMFHENPLQTSENMGPKPCQFLQRNVLQGALSPPGIHFFAKIDQFGVPYFHELQQIYLKLPIFSKFGIINWSTESVFFVSIKDAKNMYCNCIVCKGLSVRFGLNLFSLWEFVTYWLIAIAHPYLPKKSSPLSVNPTKLLHLVPLQAGIEVAVGYWSFLLHQALLLELKNYRISYRWMWGVATVILGIITKTAICFISKPDKRYSCYILAEMPWAFLDKDSIEKSWRQKVKSTKEEARISTVLCFKKISIPPP